MSKGFQATVSNNGHSISRISFHPENALKNVEEWVQKQIDFAEKHKIRITWKIVSVEGKVIGQENKQ